MPTIDKKKIIQAINSISVPQELLPAIMEKVNLLKPEDLEKIQLQYQKHVKKWKKENSKKTVKTLRSKLGGRRKTMKVQKGGELEFTLISTYLMVISVFIFIGFQSKINTCLQATKVKTQDFINNKTFLNDRSQWWENPNYTEELKMRSQAIKRRRIVKKIKETSISFPRLRHGEKIRFILEKHGYGKLLRISDIKTDFFLMNDVDLSMTKVIRDNFIKKLEGYLGENISNDFYGFLWESILEDYFLDELIKEEKENATKMLEAVIEMDMDDDDLDYEITHSLELTDYNVSKSINILIKKFPNLKVHKQHSQHIWNKGDLKIRAKQMVNDWYSLTEHYRDDTDDTRMKLATFSTELGKLDGHPNVRSFNYVNLDLLNLSLDRDPESLAKAYKKIHDDILSIIETERYNIIEEIRNTFKDGRFPLKQYDGDNTSADVRYDDDGNIEVTESEATVDFSIGSAEIDRDSFEQAVTYAEALQLALPPDREKRQTAIQSYIDAKNSFYNQAGEEKIYTKKKHSRKRSKSLRRGGGGVLNKNKYTRRMRNKRKKIKRRKTIKK